MDPVVRKHPLAECEKCPWRETGAFVPSLVPKGNLKVVVVGEAPGSYEAKTGIPFTGPSGELLDRTLEHHGIKRSEVALINICSCRPAGPTEKPPKTAIAACSGRLRADLERALNAGNDLPILAVGGTSAQTLLSDSRAISKLRIGPYRDSQYGKIIPTWHPAFCLRTPDAFPSFVRDTGKILGDIIRTWVEPQYRVFEDPDVALVALRRLLAVKKIVIDIEVASDKDIDDSHPEDYDLLCVGIAYAKGQAVVFGAEVFKDARCVEVFSELLDTVNIIGHNVKFDLLGLSPLVGLKKAHADTMLKSYCLDERPRQHGLKLRSVEDLGAPKYDEEIAEFTKGKDGSFANIPKPLLYKYNAYDVCCTWDLNELFDIQMSPEQHGLHGFLIDAVNEIMHIELEGINFDEKYNDELAVEYMEKLAKSEAEIQAHVGYELNPRSPIQILLFFANFGLILPTTQREFLEKLREELDGDLQKFVDLLLNNRNLTKTFGTYIKGLRKKVKDGKVYTTFSLHGTTSGRLNSKNPNVQNIKRDKPIRNQFTASPGRVLIQADYSQVEGRTICVLAQDEYLRDIFSDASKDIFNDMCDNIWGAGHWDKENRVSIKSIFYGYAYGRKAKSIAHELDKPVAYAQALMEEFKRLIPHVVLWQAEIKHRVLSGEDLTTPFGRKRTFHLITNDNKEDVLNEALSYMPQSIASDICLRAAVRLRPMLKQQYNAGTKLLIHDAIVVECDPHDTDAVIELMVKEMMRSGEEFSDYVPFRVDTKAGFRLGDL